MKLGKILGLFGLGGLAAAVMFGTTACPPVTPETDGGTDGGVTFQQPANTIALNFTIDASGLPNGYYKNEDLEWKGSFTYDKVTRIMTFDPAWGGGHGPYAGLWDDGPWTAGGHEPKGSVAGDKKFGITAFLDKAGMPTDGGSLTIGYGSQYVGERCTDPSGCWNWPGSNNGSAVVLPSDTEVTADGFAFPPEGDVDLRLTLDTANLGAGFTFTPPTDGGTGIAVKGTMNDWSLDPAFNDATHGDASASDGIYTYTLSANALLRLKQSSGTTVQFIWTINGAQYKNATPAGELQGVKAYTNKAAASWVERPVYEMTTGDHNTAVDIP